MLFRTHTHTHTQNGYIIKINYSKFYVNKTLAETTEIPGKFVLIVFFSLSVALVREKFKTIAVPILFGITTFIFYIITASLGYSVSDLEASGWLFSFKTISSKSYNFSVTIDFDAVNFDSLLLLGPDMCALLFMYLLRHMFNYIHIGKRLQVCFYTFNFFFFHFIFYSFHFIFTSIRFKLIMVKNLELLV